MKNYLVVVRAGDKSLHTKWLGKERNWDLVVSYYGDDKNIYISNEYLRIDCKGSKFIGLSKGFTSNAFKWADYRYIWCPDDDLDATCLGINRFFEVCDSIKADLAQPALDWSSYCSHLITLRNTSFHYRATNFVEIMAPCFSSRFLASVLPTFCENNSGWGLEWIWQRYLRGNNLFGSYIVDATPVTHTRPVGGADRGLGSNVNPLQECESLLKKYDLRYSTLNKGGRLTNGRWIDIEDNKYEFIYRLKRGQLRKETETGLRFITRSLKSFPRLIAVLSVSRAFLINRLPWDVAAVVEEDSGCPREVQLAARRLGSTESVMPGRVVRGVVSGRE
jgi:hypothetical protein